MENILKNMQTTLVSIWSNKQVGFKKKFFEIFLSCQKICLKSIWAFNWNAAQKYSYWISVKYIYWVSGWNVPADTVPNRGRSQDAVKKHAQVS